MVVSFQLEQHTTHNTSQNFAWGYVHCNHHETYTRGMVVLFQLEQHTTHNTRSFMEMVASLLHSRSNLKGVVSRQHQNSEIVL